MAYYQLHFNIDPLPGFPVGTKQWLVFSGQNEQQIKRLLEPRPHCGATLIRSATVCGEGHRTNMLPMQRISLRVVDPGIENIRRWILVPPTNTHYGN
jgi:hypothetical protein